jgi:small subunit ribosomal protein S16
LVKGSINKGLQFDSGLFFTGASISGMIKLRLKRFGKKFEASYRIVAMNNDTRRDGRPLEELGFYNPRTDEVKLNAEAITKRLQDGAQPTDTVRRILEKANLLEQKVRA